MTRLQWYKDSDKLSETMIKVHTDFNSRTTDYLNTILEYEGKDLEGQLEALNLHEGDRVVLYQDGDFEVTATLEYSDSKELLRRTLVARPDWSTIVRFT